MSYLPGRAVPGPGQRVVKASDLAAQQQAQVPQNPVTPAGMQAPANFSKPVDYLQTTGSAFREEREAQMQEESVKAQRARAEAYKQRENDQAAAAALRERRAGEAEQLVQRNFLFQRLATMEGRKTLTDPNGILTYAEDDDAYSARKELERQERVASLAEERAAELEKAKLADLGMRKAKAIKIQKDTRRVRESLEEELKANPMAKGYTPETYPDYLKGNLIPQEAIDPYLKQAHPDTTWNPFTDPGKPTREERKAAIAAGEWSPEEEAHFRQLNQEAWTAYDDAKTKAERYRKAKEIEDRTAGEIDDITYREAAKAFDAPDDDPVLLNKQMVGLNAKMEQAAVLRSHAAAQYQAAVEAIASDPSRNPYDRDMAMIHARAQYLSATRPLEEMMDGLEVEHRVLKKRWDARKKFEEMEAGAVLPGAQSAPEEDGPGESEAPALGAATTEEQPPHIRGYDESRGTVTSQGQNLKEPVVPEYADDRVEPDGDFVDPEAAARYEESQHPEAQALKAELDAYRQRLNEKARATVEEIDERIRRGELTPEEAAAEQKARLSQLGGGEDGEAVNKRANEALNAALRDAFAAEQEGKNDGAAMGRIQSILDAMGTPAKARQFYLQVKEEGEKRVSAELEAKVTELGQTSPTVQKALPLLKELAGTEQESAGWLRTVGALGLPGAAIPTKGRAQGQILEDLADLAKDIKSDEEAAMLLLALDRVAPKIDTEDNLAQELLKTFKRRSRAILTDWWRNLSDIGFQKILESDTLYVGQNQKEIDPREVTDVKLPGLRQLTEEEMTALKVETAEARRRIMWIENVQQIFEGKSASLEQIRRVKGEEGKTGWIKGGMGIAADSAPYMLSLSNPITGFMTFQSFASEERQKLRNSGLSADEINVLSSITGGIQTGIEQLQRVLGLRALKAVPGLGALSGKLDVIVPNLRTALLGRFAATKLGRLGTLAGTGAAVTGIEWAEEYLQQITPFVARTQYQMLAEAMGNTKLPRELGEGRYNLGMPWDKATMTGPAGERFWQQEMEPFFAMTPEMLIGMGMLTFGGTVGYVNANHRAYVLEQMKNRTMMRAIGVPEAEIGKLMNLVADPNKKPEEAQEAALQAFRQVQRDPNSPEAQAARQEIMAARKAAIQNMVAPGWAKASPGERQAYVGDVLDFGAEPVKARQEYQAQVSPEGLAQTLEARRQQEAPETAPFTPQEVANATAMFRHETPEGEVIPSVAEMALQEGMMELEAQGEPETQEGLAARQLAQARLFNEAAQTQANQIYEAIPALRELQAREAAAVAATQDPAADPKTRKDAEKALVEERLMGAAIKIGMGADVAALPSVEQTLLKQDLPGQKGAKPVDQLPSGEWVVTNPMLALLDAKLPQMRQRFLRDGEQETKLRWAKRAQRVAQWAQAIEQRQQEQAQADEAEPTVGSVQWSLKNNIRGEDDAKFTVEALISGKKPGGWLQAGWLDKQTPGWRKQLKDAGVHVVIVPAEEGKRGEGAAMHRDPAKAKRIAELITIQEKTREHHIELGRLLGYTDAEISGFLEKAGMEPIKADEGRAESTGPAPAQETQAQGGTAAPEGTGEAPETVAKGQSAGPGIDPEVDRLTDETVAHYQTINELRGDHDRIVRRIRKEGTLLELHGGDRAKAEAALQRAIQNDPSLAGSPVEDLTVEGRSLVVEGKYISEIYLDGNPLTVVEEEAESWLKQSIDEETLTWDDVRRFKADMEATTGEETHGDTPAELTEWFSQWAQGYLIHGASFNPDLASRIPRAIREFLVKLAQLVAKLFRYAEMVGQAIEKGALTSEYESWLKMAAGLDAEGVASLHEAEAVDALLVDTFAVQPYRQAIENDPLEKALQRGLDSVGALAPPIRARYTRAKRPIGEDYHQAKAIDESVTQTLGQMKQMMGSREEVIENSPFLKLDPDRLRHLATTTTAETDRRGTAKRLPDAVKPTEEELRLFGEVSGSAKHRWMVLYQLARKIQAAAKVLAKDGPRLRREAGAMDIGTPRAALDSLKKAMAKSPVEAAMLLQKINRKYKAAEFGRIAKALGVRNAKTKKAAAEGIMAIIQNPDEALTKREHAVNLIRDAKPSTIDAVLKRVGAAYDVNDILAIARALGIPKSQLKTKSEALKAIRALGRFAEVKPAFQARGDVDPLVTREKQGEAAPGPATFRYRPAASESFQQNPIVMGKFAGANAGDLTADMFPESDPTPLFSQKTKAPTLPTVETIKGAVTRFRSVEGFRNAFKNAGVNPAQPITPEQYRALGQELAMWLDKAQEAGRGAEVKALQDAMRALGFQEIAASGEAVTFDAVRHQPFDLQAERPLAGEATPAPSAQFLPGDAAIVTEPGWSMPDGTVLRKARVAAEGTPEARKAQVEGAREKLQGPTFSLAPRETQRQMDRFAVAAKRQAEAQPRPEHRREANWEPSIRVPVQPGMEGLLPGDSAVITLPDGQRTEVVIVRRETQQFTDPSDYQRHGMTPPKRERNLFGRPKPYPPVEILVAYLPSEIERFATEGREQVPILTPDSRPAAAKVGAAKVVWRLHDGKLYLTAIDGKAVVDWDAWDAKLKTIDANLQLNQEDESRFSALLKMAGAKDYRKPANQRAPTQEEIQEAVTVPQREGGTVLKSWVLDADEIDSARLEGLVGPEAADQIRQETRPEMSDHDLASVNRATKGVAAKLYGKTPEQLTQEEANQVKVVVEKSLPEIFTPKPLERKGSVNLRRAPESPQDAHRTKALTARDEYREEFAADLNKSYDDLTPDERATVDPMVSEAMEDWYRDNPAPPATDNMKARMQTPAFKAYQERVTAAHNDAAQRRYKKTYHQLSYRQQLKIKKEIAPTLSQMADEFYSRPQTEEPSNEQWARSAFGQFIDGMRRDVRAARLAKVARMLADDQFSTAQILAVVDQMVAADPQLGPEVDRMLAGVMDGRFQSSDDVLEAISGEFGPIQAIKPEQRGPMEEGGEAAPTFSLAGPKAKGFAQAEADERVILGLGGKLQFELDASSAQLKRLADTDEEVAFTLDEALDFPELFENYPELKTYPVTFKPLSSMGGVYFPDTKSFWLSYEPAPEEQLSYLLHEVQHAIQHIEEGDAFDTVPVRKIKENLVNEGYEEGTWPYEAELLLRYKLQRVEVEARLVQARRQLTREQRDQRPLFSDLDVPYDRITFSLAGPKARGFAQAQKKGQVFRGLDGIDRFEIHTGDSKLKIDPRESNGLRKPITRVFEFPELYRNYPEVKEIVVKVVDTLPPRDLGQFDPVNAILILSDKLDPAKARSVVLHEIQHWIQRFEGFKSQGSSPVLADHRLRMTLAALGIEPSDMDEETFAETVWEDYRRNYGEAEARIVQRRRDLTREERAERPPYADLDVDEGRITFSLRAKQDAKRTPLERAKEVAPVARAAAEALGVKPGTLRPILHAAAKEYDGQPGGVPVLFADKLETFSVRRAGNPWLYNTGSTPWELRAFQEQMLATFRTQVNGLTDSDLDTPTKAVRQLEFIARTMPPEVKAQLTGFGTMADLKTPAARRKYLLDRINRAADLLEKHNRKELTAEIGETLEKARASLNDKGIKEGKDPDMHDELDQIEAVLFMSPEEVEQAFAQNEAIVAGPAASDPDKANEVEAAERMLEMLAMYGNLHRKSARSLGEALENIENVIFTGVSLWRARKAQEAADMALRRQMAQDAISGGKGRMDSASASKLQERRRSWWRIQEFYANSLPWEWALNAITRQDKTTKTLGNPMVQHFGRIVHIATHKERRANMAKRQESQEFLAGVFGIDTKKPFWEVKLAERIRQHQKEQDTDITRVELAASKKSTMPIDVARDLAGAKVKPGDIHPSTIQSVKDALARHDAEIANLEAMIEGMEGEADTAANERRKKLQARLAGMRRREVIEYDEVTNTGQAVKQRLSQDSATYLTMLWAQEEMRPVLEFHGWTPEVMEEVEAFLTPESKQIRDWLTQRYDANYREINAVYRRLYGVNLDRIKNYAPARFVHETQTQQMMPDSPMMAGASLTPGFLRQRVAHRAEPKIVDALTLYDEHLRNSIHFTSWAESVKELRKVLGNRETQTLIRQYYGDHLNQAVQDSIQRFADGGARNAQIVSWLDNSRMHLTVAALALKPSIGIKQLTSFPAFAFDIPLAAYVRNHLTFFSHTLNEQGEWVMDPAAALKNMRMLWELPFIQERFASGYGRDMRQAMNKLGADPTMISRLAQESMIFGRLGDVGPIITSGFTVFRFAYDEARAKGMSHEEAKKEAILRFERSVERAQQAGDLKDLGIWEGGGSYGRAMTMFLRSPIQYYLNSWESVWDAVRGRKDGWKEAGRRLFIGNVVLPVLFRLATDFILYGMAALEGDDEDKEKLTNLDTLWRRYVVAMMAGPFSGLLVVGHPLVDIMHDLFGLQVVGGGNGAMAPLKEYRTSAGRLMTAFGNAAEDGATPNEIVAAADAIAQASARTGLTRMAGPWGDKVADASLLYQGIRNFFHEFQVDDQMAKATETAEERADRLAKETRQAYARTREAEKTAKPAPETDAEIRRLQAMGVSSGERARWIYERLKGLEGAERTTTIQKWRAEGVLTPEVESQVRNLQRSGR